MLTLDVKECTDGSHKCNHNADCVELDGSYDCKCKTGFNGNGNICTGENI